MSKFKSIIVLVFFTLLANTSHATDMFWPGVIYDDKTPKIETILGYQTGSKITNHTDMLKYFDALVDSKPDHIKKFKYAESWEGRDLVYFVIGNEDRLAQLDQFETDIQKLADPRIFDTTAANDLLKSLPASVWLGYGVHGNEISSTDAAMMTAYHLLASQDNPMTQNTLDNTLVFIDPLQNPDGRTRFTQHYYSTVGMEASGDRYSADQNEPWPQGRSNHYLFDMNRDWLAMTQPETQGRIAAMNRFMPLVVIDLHEMGGDMSYYFAPAAEPMNPLMTKEQINNMATIGKNHAKHFDAMGYDYFTREIFDAFYPGYGDSWPTFYGASASTYEVGSARGEVFIKRSGEAYTYADSVQKHFIASISTIEATAINRTKLLKDFRQYQVSAIQSGRKKANYIIPTQQDRAGAHKLAQLLTQHGIEVQQTQQDIKGCGQNFKAGSFIIDPAQPRGRMADAMLLDQIDMDETFINIQEKRRGRNLPDQIYDLTAWSLPLMFNLDVVRCSNINTRHLSAFNSQEKLPAQITNPNATVAYLVPWGDMAAGRLLTQGLRLGLTIKSSDLPFTHDNTAYSAGTLIIEVKRNNTQLAEQINLLARSTGAIVVGVNSSWVSDGPSFGSANVVTMKAPKIAMAWDQPTSSLSAGNSRFVIERQLGYPVTAIRSSHLNQAELQAYDVLILPSGQYQDTLTQAGVTNITNWIEQGGVLITFGAATDYALGNDAKWLAVKKELAHIDNSKTKTAKNNKTSTEKKSNKQTSEVAGSLLTTQDEMMQAIKAEKPKPTSVSGALARVAVDQDHWLTAGVKPEVIGMITGNQIITPIKLDKGKNLAWFKGPDEILASGFLWEESRQQLAYKPFLIHQPSGKGMVIAYTQEPTLRAFLDGLHVMLTNTLFRSVAHSDKLQ